jgi:tRNA A-37 threonylcarbamoyl transferase component Bud32
VRAEQLDAIREALSDRYRLEREIGHGGMATVYLAQDLKHERPVAIKVLRPELTAALGRERFLREIQIAAKLNHPHILTLHDSGDAGGFLYYVMPYVEGESLEERLARERQLPVEEAVRIVREVASALAYAHARGVVHRDIKPANILLSNGFALVADFGLARAITRAKSSTVITHSGLVVGSPAYMSPEQSAGEAELDGRSDIYALGCVLYELLAGDPPFTASNPAALLARHAAAPVPPIRVVRPSVPGGLERALQKALEKVPADRFGNAEEFARALEAPAETAWRSGGTRRWVGWTAAGVATVAVATAVVLIRGGNSASRSNGAGDTTVYAVLPFDQPGSGGAADVDQLLQASLSRWTGITLIERVRVAQAVGKIGGRQLDERRAAQIAHRLGAGRYFSGQVIPIGDSLEVRGALHDAVSGGFLAGRSIRVPRASSGADALVGRLAADLLFQGRLELDPEEGWPGSRSVPAMDAFMSGKEAVRRWELPAADSAFAHALSYDNNFARASLWLAQLRAWQGLPSRIWRLQAERALASRSGLGARDSALAEALSALSRGDYVAACAEWRGMTARWPADFSIWYGAAMCLSLDTAVRPDRASPSGWSFRTSYHQAQLAWRRAFELLPAVGRDFLPSGRTPGQWILWTATNRLRRGWGIRPDTGAFSALPSLARDTLAFIPYPEREFYSVRARVAAPSTQEAVRRQRRAFYDLASEWRSSSPRNLDAQEALASALWLLGNPTASDSIHAARAAARRPADRIRLGLTEALMRILRGAPDGADLEPARLLIDSLVASGSAAPETDPWDLATMAAITGKADEAARLIRLPSPRTTAALPPGLASDAFALLAFASMGGPPESLAVLERRVDRGIATAVEPRERVAARLEWLARPVSIADPEYRSPSLPSLAGFGDYLIDAEAAYVGGDTARARRRLGQAASDRSWMQPSDLMLETLHPEAAMLAGMGDVRAAVELLDPTLSALGAVSIELVRDPVGAGMLMRALALRAELAERIGDRASAARWGRAVATLWSGADSFLQPVVVRMRHLARR